MEDYQKMLCALEERLVQNDEKRSAVQSEVEEVCSKVDEEADTLEETIASEIHKAFDPREEGIYHLIETLRDHEGEGEKSSLSSLMDAAQKELASELKYDLKHYKWAESFCAKYKLVVSQVPAAVTSAQDAAHKIDCVIDNLQAHLDRMHEAVNAAKSQIGDLCVERHKEVEELRNKINAKLEPVYTEEDFRIQGLVKEAREAANSENFDELKKD